MPSFNDNTAALHVREKGAGTPVIALHGSLSSGAQWGSLTGYLSGRYKVVTPDLPGYGQSPALAPDATLSDIAATLLPLIDRETEPCHLVGHSFGGAVAAELAMLRPDRIASLSLIEPTMFYAIPNETRYRTALGEVRALAALMGAACRLGHRGEAAKCFLDFWLGNGAWDRCNAQARTYFVDRARPAANDFRAVFEQPFDRQALRALGCPILFMAGTQSPSVVNIILDSLKTLLPAMEVHRIPGTGHLLPLTDPHIVDPTIGAHIGKALAGSQPIDWPAAA